MKIFRKEKALNGVRRLYFCGIKIASYKKKTNVSIIDRFVDSILLHDGVNDFQLQLLKNYLLNRNPIFLKGYHRLWLITINALYRNGERNIAESLLIDYISGFSLLDIHRFEAVCLLAYNMGYRNAEIENSYAIYSKVRAIRQEQRFENLVKSAKKIAIVGRSPILLGKNLGEEIDSHDLVIRFNNSDVSGKYKDDYGVKMDINSICISLKIETEDENVLTVFKDFKSYDTPLSVLDTIKENFHKNIDFLDYGVKKWIVNESGLNDPTSGTMLIMWVKKILGSLDKVDIYGFAYQDKNKSLNHFDNKNLLNTFYHNMESEINFLKNLIK